MGRFFRCGTILALVASLCACSPPRQVAVEERTTVTRAQEAERIGGQHIRIVQPGDTLYAIAFANGLNAQHVAAWNKKDDTAKLRVGERLRLTAPIGFVMPTPSPRPSPAQGRVQVIASGKQTQSSANVTPRSTAAAPKSAPVSQPKAQVKSPWRWPTAGKVTKGFNLRSGQQGINIGGAVGQPIAAAQAGEVVYVGNSLKGYGNLVILKHTNEFLSAYAHNLETFVQEGQQIMAGQRIATMGRIRDQAALHFQIRLNGEPVDPRRYLSN